MGFIDRHRDLTIRQPEATSMSSAVAFNRPQVDCFFSLLQLKLRTCQIDGDMVYNMDESGLNAVHIPGCIIAKKGKNK